MMAPDNRHFFNSLWDDLRALVAADKFDVDQFKRIQFRIMWACPTPGCPTTHIAHGDFMEVLNAMTVMLELGFPAVTIEREDYAMERDAEAAEELLPSLTHHNSPPVKPQPTWEGGYFISVPPRFHAAV